MTTFDRIKELSRQRNKNVKEVAKELNFGENLFYKWKTQSPTTDNLQKVADYFNVSTDYLLGRINDPNLTNNDIEAAELIHSMLSGNDQVVELTKKISKLSDEDYKTVEDLVDFLLEKNKKTQG